MAAECSVHCWSVMSQVQRCCYRPTIKPGWVCSVHWQAVTVADLLSSCQLKAQSWSVVKQALQSLSLVTAAMLPLCPSLASAESSHPMMAARHSMVVAQGQQQAVGGAGRCAVHAWQEAGRRGP